MTCGGHPKRQKTISRRSFLRGAAAASVTSLTQRVLGGNIPQTQAAESGHTPEQPVVSIKVAADDLDHHVYIPLVVRQPAGVPHGPSKFGLHTIRPNNATGFVQDVHDAGTCVALVKAVDWFGFLREIKTISPETTTIGRWSGQQSVDASGDPAEKAAQLMANHMQRWTYERDVVDYWEVLNEVDPPTIEGHFWLAQFFIEAMNVADANGYKLALFSYSVGVPQWEEWEAIVETGVFAQAKETGHVLALHEYNYPTMDYRWGEPLPGKPAYADRGVLSGRYRHLYRDFLIPRDEVVPLAITEGGLEPVLWQPGMPTTWKDRLVEEMAWYDDRLREDDYVIGIAMFTIGSIGAWELYDYEELLPDFYDHIVSLKDA
jgi:hypothetical protein